MTYYRIHRRSRVTGERNAVPLSISAKRCGVTLEQGQMLIAGYASQDTAFSNAHTYELSPVEENVTCQTKR